MLVYVVDVSDNEKQCPVQDFLAVREELRLFNPELLKRPSLVFANKTDECESQWAENLEML